jgi:uncharacterized protein YndB with AHSA1/START domain
MTKKAIVKDQIEINASKEKIWEVLTNPDFIRLWDDMPENYSSGHLRIGSIIEWKGYSKMTVTEFNRPSKLKMNLYLPKVELAPSAYDVNYTYYLNEENGKTILRFEIGDYSSLPKSKDYYEASLEWVETAKQKIKELAEK